MEFRWLGTGGIEISSAGITLLIDPFFTRPSKLQVLFSRLSPKQDRISRHLERWGPILITHAHYDHLMDVPLIQAMTGAEVFCGGNALRLLRALGVEESGLRETRSGDEIRIGPFLVTVLPGDHVRFFGRIPLSGELGSELPPPRRLWDYRSDQFHNYHITTGEESLLLWNGPGVQGAPRADVLLLQPFYDARCYLRLIDAVRPLVVIPIHWDDFTRPLSEPPRILPAVGWGDRSLARCKDLEEFMVGAIPAGGRKLRVLIPKRMRRYDLKALPQRG